MKDFRQTRSWIWHPGIAVLAAAVAVVAFGVWMSQVHMDLPVAVSVVAAAGVDLATGFYLTMFWPLPDEEQPEHNWWPVGTWLVGTVLTMFVMIAAKQPGSMLWPALILAVPWYVAIFRAIPPQRASRPLRGVLAACLVAVGVAFAPFAWSGNSPMPPLDGAAIGYLWGLAVAAVFLRAGESWRRVGAVLSFAVAFSILSSQLVGIVPVLLTVYLFAWIRRRRIGSTTQTAVA